MAGPEKKKFKGPKPQKPDFDNDPSTIIHKKRRKRPQDELTADAPRAYRTLMKWQAHAKQRAEERATKPKEEKIALKIRKGESMSDFSRRVNESVPLPMAKGVNDAKAMKTSQRQRAKADRLRAEYKTRLDKRRGRTEDDDGADLDAENWKKSGKRDTSPDPWAHLQQSRPKFGDVVDKPPELPKLKRMSNVPKSAGSLARRELLESERQNVIDEYRRLKARKEQKTEDD